MINGFKSIVDIKSRDGVDDAIIGMANVDIKFSNAVKKVSFEITFRKPYGKRMVNVTVYNITESESYDNTITHSGMVGKKLDTILYNLLGGYIRLDYISFRNLLLPVLAQAKEAFTLHCNDEQVFVLTISLSHVSA